MNKKRKKINSSEKHALLVKGNLEEIKKYFLKVRELMFSGELYPVDLDKVWPLVYSSKQKATDSLKKNFHEVVDYVMQKPDYQRFNQLVEVKTGGDYRTEKYYLTVFALEWFVARQSREIFAVYREVFHMFVQITTPIAGVMPIFAEGRVWYDYKKICKALGIYPDWHRKKRMPMHFSVIYRSIFITPELAIVLYKEAEFRERKKELLSLQTSIPFPDDDTEI